MSATMSLTNREVLTRHKIQTHGIEHLDAVVPVLTDPQAQGDVLVLTSKTKATKGEPIPANGVMVVRGETESGNSHILHSLEGECYWTPAKDAETDLVQGYLHVPEGSAATLIHTQEHNVIGIGPGNYEIKRQREFRNEWARVRD